MALVVGVAGEEPVVAVTAGAVDVICAAGAEVAAAQAASKLAATMNNDTFVRMRAILIKVSFVKQICKCITLFIV